MVAPFDRRTAIQLAEALGEVRKIIKSHIARDFRDLLIGLTDHQCGFLKSEVCQIGAEIAAGLLFELPGKVFRIQVNVVCQIVQSDIGHIIFLDIQNTLGNIGGREMLAGQRKALLGVSQSVLLQLLKTVC